MKIAIGCDHTGYELKQHVIDKLTGMGHEVVDKGCYSADRVDYPDYGFAVAEAVAAGECERGVLICLTGIGMSMAANKVSGIRAALARDVFSVKMTRRHNDANIIAIGAGISGVNLVDEMLDVFFTEPFDGGRHINRIEKLNNYKK